MTKTADSIQAEKSARMILHENAERLYEGK